jgi:hypothetical protein
MKTSKNSMKDQTSKAKNSADVDQEENYDATTEQAQQFKDAVDQIGDLAGILGNVRKQLVLAGCGRFDAAEERNVLIRMEQRLRTMHVKLATRLYRTNIISDPI